MIPRLIRYFRCLGPCLLLVVVAGNSFAADKSTPEEVPAPSTTREALLDSLLGDDPLAGGPTEPVARDERPGTKAARQQPDSEGQKPAEPAANLPVGDDQKLAEFVRAAAQLRKKLEQAEAKLAAGQTGPQTQKAQAEAIAATERLIELLQQKATSTAKSRSNNAAGRQSGQPASGQQQPSPPRPGAAAPAGSASQTTMSGRNRLNDQGASSARPPTTRDTAAVYSAFRQRIIEHSWGHLPGQIRQRLRGGGADNSLPRYEALVNRYFNSLVRPERQPAGDQRSRE